MAADRDSGSQSRSEDDDGVKDKKEEQN